MICRRVPVDALKRMKIQLLSLVVALFSVVISSPVELDRTGIRINGRYTILRGGSFQWFRIPQEEWEDRFQRFTSLGYNFLDMYVAWRNHEISPGVFDWSTYNITRFLDLAKEFGIYVYFRPGPYITNEMDGGGFPYWVRAQVDKHLYNTTHSDGKMNLRSEEYDYMNAVERYLSTLNDVIKPYLITNGGTIVFYAVENE